MSLEIARRLISGKWKTVLADESGSGAGIPQGGPLTQDLDAGGNTVLNLADPTGGADAQAATKKYVDDNGGGSSDIKLATKPLTNDNIAGLPSTVVEVIPAPGSGKMLMPIFGTIMVDSTAAPYTGIDSGSTLGLEPFLFTDSFVVALNEGNTHPFCTVSDLLAAGKAFALLQSNGLAKSQLLGAFFTAEAYSYMADGLTFDAYDDKPLNLFATNAGGTDYTGGDPANVGLVTVVYYIITLPE